MVGCSCAQGVRFPDAQNAFNANGGYPLWARRYTVGLEVMDVQKEDENVPEGYEVVYTKYITLRNGKRLYASTYGRTAWRLVVRKKK